MGERVDQPRLGTRKLHAAIRAQGVSYGRDRLFKLLRERGMLIRRKRRFQKTTYSKHSYAVAPNEFKHARITRPKQALVSDSTYIPLRRGFAYLFLVTDAFSRKILGYHLSKDLTHYSALLAVDMAVQELESTDGVIHHSDRGCQYCCHQYLDYLRSYGMTPSMTDESHCYQNALAERVNGILKDEFDLDATFADFAEAKGAVDKAIQIYNSRRMHGSLNLRTPDQVHALAA